MEEMSQTHSSCWSEVRQLITQNEKHVYASPKNLTAKIISPLKTTVLIQNTKLVHQQTHTEPPEPSSLLLASTSPSLIPHLKSAVSREQFCSHVACYQSNYWQLETACLFWMTLGQFKKFKKLPIPELILLVPGSQLLGRKDKVQPAGQELLKAHVLPGWEEPSARKGNPKICFCTSSVTFFQSLVGFALGQVKPLVMAMLQLSAMHVYINTMIKLLWQDGGGRATGARDSAAKEARLPLWRTPFLFLLIFSFLWLPSALPLTTTHATFSHWGIM